MISAPRLKFLLKSFNTLKKGTLGFYCVGVAMDLLVVKAR